MKNQTNIYIGTSGWSYKHWKDVFYPSDLNEKAYLKFYSEYFSTVEINSSFYHFLNPETIDKWTDIVPNDFIFSVKANRHITHTKRLKDADKTVPDFMKSLFGFKHKLGPILFQLPPSFAFDAQRLKSFTEELPKDYRYIFEFRNNQWFNPETYDILKNINAGFCIYNLGGVQSPKEITSDFAYIRLHGSINLGQGEYSSQEIEKISEDIKKFTAEKKDVYCYFNNDQNGYAVKNALELRKKFQEMQSKKL